MKKFRKNKSAKKIWLIRHAEAVEAEDFPGSDLKRPLTPPGKRSSKKVFTKLASLYDAPDIVISSKAVRARETAEIFCAAFGIKKFRESRLLNPGCRFRDIRRVVASVPDGMAFIALVGHEPDFSHAAEKFISAGERSIKLKKGGIAGIQFGRDAVELTMLISPGVLGG